MTSAWDAWVGNEEQRRDRVDEGLVRRWLATLDRAGPADGTAPQAFHWCLCPPDAPTASLGADGHPRRDGSPQNFLPLTITAGLRARALMPSARRTICNISRSKSTRRHEWLRAVT